MINIVKSINIYVDNSENRKKHRVGHQYDDLNHYKPTEIKSLEDANWHLLLNYYNSLSLSQKILLNTSLKNIHNIKPDVEDAFKFSIDFLGELKTPDITTIKNFEIETYNGGEKVEGIILTNNYHFSFLLNKNNPNEIHLNLIDTQTSDIENPSKQLGFKLVDNFITNAKKYGFKTVSLHASRNDKYGFFGYSYWPKLGFRMDEEGYGYKRFVKLLKDKNIDESVYENDIRSFLAIPENDEYWRKDGYPFDAIFDLQENSLSNKLFNNYKILKRQKNAEKN